MCPRSVSFRLSISLIRYDNYDCTIRDDLLTEWTSVPGEFTSRACCVVVDSANATQFIVFSHVPAPRRDGSD